MSRKVCVNPTMVFVCHASGVVVLGLGDVQMGQGCKHHRRQHGDTDEGSEA